MQAVLVIEDSIEDAQILEQSLNISGSKCRVVTAHDADEAERILYSNDSDRAPDLVLLDARVAPFGGLRILDRLKLDKRTRGIPVVVISSASTEAEIQELYRHGANSYIEKPADSRAFGQLAARTAKYWLNLNLPLPRHSMSKH